MKREEGAEGVCERLCERRERIQLLSLFVYISLSF